MKKKRGNARRNGLTQSTYKKVSVPVVIISLNKRMSGEPPRKKQCVYRAPGWSDPENANIQSPTISDVYARLVALEERVADLEGELEDLMEEDEDTEEVLHFPDRLCKNPGCMLPNYRGMKHCARCNSLIY